VRVSLSDTPGDSAVIDLTGSRYYFESVHAPNVAWIDCSRSAFGKGTGERGLH
jgi:penicillin V acylase-like amidase (Ntn superfamily)